MRTISLITIMFGLLRWCYLPTFVSGTSMEPSLKSGSVYLADRQAYSLDMPQRGDVVVAKVRLADELLVKRVIGLPGEEIKMIWGRVYVNGRLLAESYLHPTSGWCMLPITLEPDQYWIIGDNRDVSSHVTVGLPEIVGKLVSRQHALPTCALPTRV